MKTSARYQAVYELISEIFKDIYPADNIINEYVRSRKYIGSKDRRFIIDTVWEIIRQRMRLAFIAESREARKILLVYLKNEDFDLISDDSPYGLKPLSKEEKIWLKNLKQEKFPAYVEAECPQWLYDKISDPALVESLNEKAPADLRVNMAQRELVQKKLRLDGLFFSLTPYSPFGLRSEERVNLNNCPAYQEGLVEVQDEASQVAALLADVSADEKVVDYCAGAGGKSLAFAAINRNEGIIEAYDANWNRMDAIKNRAQRLGIRNLKIMKTIEDRDYDRFIIDAPCSGSGTWRRSPDAKFRLSPKKLAALNVIQQELLQTAYAHTKPGGKIVYMTCSVLRDENENIVEAFAQKYSDIVFADHKKLWQQKIDAPYLFQETKYIKLSPLTTNTDGFFFCLMEKKASEDELG